MNNIRRFILATLVVSVATPAALLAQRVSDTQPRKVVFVCEHGTVKSVVALEYFNRIARAKGIGFKAVSRGTRPDSALPSQVRDGLTRDGFDLAGFRASPFTSADVQSAALVVTLDVDVEGVVNRSRPVVRWDSLPSVMSNYAAGRTAIRAHVERLVDSLSNASRVLRHP